MGTFSIWHWLILIAVVAVLFGGRGKISSLMGDVAHGIRSFREGLKEPPQEPKVISDNKTESADVRKAEEADQKSS